MMYVREFSSFLPSFFLSLLSVQILGPSFGRREEIPGIGASDTTSSAPLPQGTPIIRSNEGIKIIDEDMDESPSST